MHSQQQDLWRTPECFEGRKKLYSNAGEIVSLWIEGISPVMSTIDRQRRKYDRAQYNISWGGCRKGNMLITITDVPVKQYYQEGKDFSRQLQLIQAHIGDLTKVNEMVRCSDETKFYGVNNTMCTADGKRRGGKK